MRLPPHNSQVILFDGVCGLCNRFVRFVLKRDRRRLFYFAPLQGELSARILKRHGRSPDALDTVYLVREFGTGSEYLTHRSSAALRVLNQLGRLWILVNLFWLVPSRLRDFAYGLVAKSRYRLFGRHDHCPVPTDAERARFLWDS